MGAVDYFNSPLFHTKEQEIEEVYSNWKKAVMSTDLQFLENLLSDDFKSASAAGIIKNKSEVLTRLGFKDVKYLLWEDKDLSIDIKEDNAIVKSHQTLNIELYGLPIKIEREIILTLVNNDAKWYLRNIKETSV